MFTFRLQFFNAPVQGSNVQTTTKIPQTIKEFYDTTLLENAKEVDLLSQFGKKTPIKGNKVEWRKFNTFAKALTPLTEGVIPDGSTFGMTKIETDVNQYGDYTTVSDRLELEAVDNVIMGATEEMGSACGATFATLTRNKLLTGTNVMYCHKTTDNGNTEGEAVTSRTALDNTCILTPREVSRASTILAKNKAPKINGYYVAIIHPSVMDDLRNTKAWEDYHKHNDTAPIFKGEIGELHGVKFISGVEAKVYKETTKPATYATLFLGKDAFGIVEPKGEGTEMIIKDKSVAGGPLEQFNTIGYKFCHGARILYEERILRVESGSSYGNVDIAN